MPPLFSRMNLLRYVLDAYPKSRLAEVAWAFLFRTCVVLYLAWFAEVLMGPSAGPVVPFAMAIIALGLVQILPWLWACLRRLWARVPRRKAVAGASSADSQTSVVPRDASKDRRA